MRATLFLKGLMNPSSSDHFQAYTIYPDILSYILCKVHFNPVQRNSIISIIKAKYSDLAPSFVFKLLSDADLCHCCCCGCTYMCVEAVLGMVCSSEMTSCPSSDYNQMYFYDEKELH